MRTLAAFLVVAHAFVSPGRRLLAPRRLAAPTSNEGCEVYVGNIARQTDEHALREAFEERYGEVKGVRLPGSAVGDAHRGFGFSPNESRFVTPDAAHPESPTLPPLSTPATPARPFGTRDEPDEP